MSNLYSQYGSGYAILNSWIVCRSAGAEERGLLHERSIKFEQQVGVFQKSNRGSEKDVIAVGKG